MITAQIRSELPRMSGSLRKVGLWVLERPHYVPKSSASEVGQSTGTSQATVTRFCQALGLASYRDLQYELAKEQGQVGSEEPEPRPLGPDIGPDDPLDRLVSVVARADLQALRRTAESLDLDALDRAARTLAAARRIDVYGVGGSGVIALEAEARLFGIGCDARARTEVHAAETSAALLTPADAVVALSHSGATREVLGPLRLAAERGAATIAVTGDPRSPVARAAGVHLGSTSAETGFRRGGFGTRHSVLLIVDCLYARVAQLTYGRATASLALTARIADGHR
ncbi:MurR/RpiR family transcriptional regulator [Streptomyces sp. NPDC056501]|uniref:MurR/RpiR family transcriptional regulator n=1 Tax=Streptomyces sp. NPDC056501 TaxID=3345841 RepID=UPI00369E5B4C